MGEGPTDPLEMGREFVRALSAKVKIEPLTPPNGPAVITSGIYEVEAEA